jgi:PTS system mannose-specific IID component
VLPTGTLVRVFLRSLLLQAAWNPQGMQNLGLAYTLYPALRRLYPEPRAQAAAVQRHLVFFNTHPYVAAAIVGGVLFHEQRVARGEEGPERVVAFKAALMGPLAALGDGFFWLSLRPAVGAVCAALALLLGPGAALVFLALYNVVHLWLRVRLFRLGLLKGERLVEGVAKVNLPTRGARLREVAALGAGAVAGWVAVGTAMDPGALGHRLAGGGLGPLVGTAGEGAAPGGSAAAPWLALGCLAAGVGTYFLLARRPAPYAALYAAAGLATLAGMLL